MASMDLSTRGSDGQVVVALRGELDTADAASVAAALVAVAARAPEIIVDLAGLELPAVYLQRGGAGSCRRVSSAGRADDR